MTLTQLSGKFYKTFKHLGRSKTRLTFIQHVVFLIFSFVRWCEQDLCLVVSKQKSGCYESSTAPLDAGLVYE